MKKLNTLIAILICCSIITLSADAQTEVSYRFGNRMHVLGKKTIPNRKADFHFRRAFDIPGEKWSETADGYRAGFVNKYVRYMVDYDRNGNWIRTIKSYSGDSLSLVIAKSVMSAYLGYTVVFATEVEMARKRVYFVKIENKDSLKTIRISDGDMDVVESYRKK